MARVLLGMGSNIEPELNLVRSAAVLRSHFGDVIFSSVYRSAAVGMDGDDFLNACCLFDTELPQPDVCLLLKEIEDLQQRDRSEGSWKPRTLDLDLLIYDAQVVGNDLYRYAHAFVPAAELIAAALPTDAAGLLTRVPLRL